MEDKLSKLIERGEKLGANYVEIRVHSSDKTILIIKDGRLETIKEGMEKGIAIRVLVNGAWGFASPAITDNQTLTKTITTLCKMAKNASQHLKKPVKLAETKTIKDKVKLKSLKSPNEVSLDEKIDLTLNMNKKTFEYDKRIKSCTIYYLDSAETLYYMNSDGTCIEQDKNYVWSSITVTSKENDRLAEGNEEIGSAIDFEHFRKQAQKEEIVLHVTKTAIEQLNAKPPKGGIFPVVIAPNVTGVLIHEAFGHLAEADLTLTGSALANKQGKKIASEHVTIFDDGTFTNGFGSFKYDDEGTPTQKTCLIEKGQLIGLMHNRETASKFNTKPTGNARAEDFRNEPIIRMSNTYLAPGDYNLEELFEDIKFGYYLKRLQGGEANLDGTFQVGIQEAYSIINGKPAQPIRNVSISGNTLKTLLYIEAVGKDLTLFPGRCGKEGQTIFTSDGGPHIRVKEVLVGGSA
jgi:TldD protein